MNKKFKFLTVLLALVMTIGAFAPFGAVKAADETTESVTLHKILQTKENLNAKKEEKDVFPGTKGLDDTEYDGNLIGKKEDNTQTQEDIKNALIGYFGTGSEDIGGVYFAWAKKDTDGKYYWIKSDGNFTDTKTEVNEKELDNLPTDTFGGTTVKDNGIEFATKTFKGEYKIYEIHEKSTYKGANGENLADNKAVPVIITLPLVNENGIVEKAHVYPKNTQDKPKVDKDFKDGNELRPVDEKDADEIHGGADVDNNQRDKKVATADLGENIPYEIKTVIPAKTKYKTLAWDDTMDKGLTFNDDVKLQIGGADATLGTDYIVSYKENGFTIQLLQAGLDKVYDQKEDKEIYITYSATVNGEAEVDKTEKNKLKFYYDNNISVKGKPEPTNPVDGKLRVTKDFPNVTGNWVEGEEVIVTIIDEETGKPVEFKDGQIATVVLTKDKQTHEWTGLDNNKKYKVVETFKPSDIVTYEKSENGKVIIHDEIKPEKPNEIEPSVPEVILGGRKFVKTNNEDKSSDKLERLAGAEFYVKNEKGEYLLATTDDKEKADAKIAAKKALDDAIKAYKDLSAEEQKGQKGTEAKNLIEQKQKEYNKAYIAAEEKYTWGAKEDPEDASKENPNVVILKSNEDGQFEIKGLAYGTYYLEEKTAPEGYAKLQSEQKFEVKEGSYASKDADSELQYNKENTDAGYGLQIKNKKVSIPETGGIGTVIFTVVGVMLMVGAAFALKRRKEDELEGLA